MQAHKEMEHNICSMKSNLTSRRPLWDHWLGVSDPVALRLRLVAVTAMLGEALRPSSVRTAGLSSIVLIDFWGRVPLNIGWSSSFKNCVSILNPSLIDRNSERRWNSVRLSGLAKIIHLGNGRIRTEIQHCSLHSALRLWCLCQLEQYPNDAIMSFSFPLPGSEKFIHPTKLIRESEGGFCVGKGVCLPWLHAFPRIPA